MGIALLVLLIIASLAGIALSAMQLPGAWLILAAAAGYDWYYGWQSIGWPWLAALTGAALVCELLEVLASAVFAGRAGANRRASVGAVVGGLVGMFVLTIPIPIVGTILGGMAGCFAGAVIAELTVRGDLATGARVGWAATLGRIAGMAIKTTGSVVIAGIVVVLIVW